MNRSENKQQKHEMLSAFIDAEQSDVEITQVVDELLNEPTYKDRYIRMLLINDSLHDQFEQSVLTKKLHDRVSSALGDLPAHYVDQAVKLQNVATNDVTQTHWFKKVIANKVVSGVSVAASVMFVTLLTLQTFNSESNNSPDPAIAVNPIPVSPIVVNQKAPSLIQTQPEVPVSLAASGSINNKDFQQQYQWIEADPALSRHIRKYINQHDTNRAAYQLQPKIRSATFQINE